MTLFLLGTIFNFMILLVMCDFGIAIVLVSRPFPRSVTRRGDANKQPWLAHANDDW